MKNLILQTQGGHGKQIACTALLKGLKKKYPDRNIIVNTSFEHPFAFNPNVYRVFVAGQQAYFYEDYIRDKDALVLFQEPYTTTEHIYGRQHLIKTWFELYGIPYKNETPEIFLKKKEVEAFAIKFGVDDRPVLVIHPFGGPEGNPNVMSWYRDMPVDLAQRIVNHYAQAGFRVVQIKSKNQLGLQNCQHLVSTNLRDCYHLLKISRKRILIDSFAQHAAAALGLKSTVLFSCAKQKICFGYDTNDNVLAVAEMNDDWAKYSMYERFDIGGDVLQYPFEDGEEIYDMEEIVKTTDGTQPKPMPKIKQKENGKQAEKVEEEEMEEINATKWETG